MPEKETSRSSIGTESGRRLVTEVPGPESVRLLDDLARYECPAITARRARRADETGVDGDPIVWRTGRGAVIEDVDGNHYLDFTAAFAVSGYGHAHPELVAALTQQAQQLMHGMGDVYPTEPKIAFARALAELLPGDLTQSIFAQSGAEAVDAAIKTATVASGRRRILAFQGGYHGLSLGALSVTAYRSSFRTPFAHRIDHNVTHVPYANCYRCPLQLEHPSCGLACLSQIEASIDNPASGMDDVGAVFVEPIQGRGGTVIPPDAWLVGLVEMCRARDIVVVFDEIYTGFARTGEVFAMGHTGVVPDLVCLGKGMTGGFPMSAVVGTSAVMASWGNSAGEAIHTSTFLGNPMGCAVGLAAIEMLQREQYEVVATTRGAQLQAGLRVLQARYPDRIGDVRGRGLMVAAELVTDSVSKSPDGMLCVQLMRRMLEKGVLVLPSGVYGNVLAFTPPFVITEAQIDEMLGVLGETLAELID